MPTKTYNNILLSVLVPVYNVEDYVRPCLESILGQGLDEDCYEVIIVNDGTQDNSMGVIDDIIKQHPNIRVIEQENQGLSVCRNRGIEAARGEYILFVDSDDLLIAGSLKPLLSKAIESEADLTTANFLKMGNQEISNCGTITQKPLEVAEKTGTELFLNDLEPTECYVWRTLYRKAFLTDEHITFVPGIYFEDQPFTYECYLRAKKCLKTNILLNIYRKRQGAVTNTFNKKRANDYFTAVAKAWNLSHIEGLPEVVQERLKKNVHFALTRAIWDSLYSSNMKFKDICEAISIFRREAPDFKFADSWAGRAATFAIKRLLPLYVALFLIRKNIR